MGQNVYKYGSLPMEEKSIETLLLFSRKIRSKLWVSLFGMEINFNQNVVKEKSQGGSIFIFLFFSGMTVSKLLTLKEKNLRLLLGLYKLVDFILVILKFCLTGKKGTLGIMSSCKEFIRLKTIKQAFKNNYSVLLKMWIWTLNLFIACKWKF